MVTNFAETFKLILLHVTIGIYFLLIKVIGSYKFNSCLFLQLHAQILRII